MTLGQIIEELEELKNEYRSDVIVDIDFSRDSDGYVIPLESITEIKADLINNTLFLELN